VSRRRVVVTGLGVVSSIGSTTRAFWEGCLAGKSVVEEIPERWRRYADYKSSLWAPLPDLDYVDRGLSRVEISQHDPVALQAAAAAGEALADAGLAVELKSKRANTYEVAGVDAERAAVFMGTGIGGASSFLANHAYQILARPRQALEDVVQGSSEPGAVSDCLHRLLEDLSHGRRFNPFVVSMLMPNAVSAFLGLKYSLTGLNHTSSLACAAGTVAIGEAFRAIRDGRVDMALAGGTEYLSDEHGGIFRGFDIAKTLVRDCGDPQGANRPFDAKRSGFLFSQGGAGVIVLEELKGALRRGARPLAELAGYGESFDAHSMMNVASDGVQVERMVRLALRDAELEVADIDYVNSHGTGTMANDAVEAAVIERVFGAHVLVNATKSLLGHTIGASGALEAVVTVLSLQHQRTHACKNLEEPIAELNFVLSAEPVKMAAALSQSFAFGGHNAALIFKRWQEA